GRRIEASVLDPGQTGQPGQAGIVAVVARVSARARRHAAAQGELPIQEALAIGALTGVRSGAAGIRTVRRGSTQRVRPYTQERGAAKLSGPAGAAFFPA